VKGEAISSPGLAEKIEIWQNRGLKEVSILIGGVNGVSPRVAERADISLSLSFLTFTHEMSRVIVMEQLYRAYTIIKGFPYQK
jgi:23S rRNA (pseudouridine1915-N3)-methyltransferase